MKILFICMKLKNLIREIHDGHMIYPSDIYNLFFLEVLYFDQPQLFKSEYGEFILHTYTTALKSKYLSVFKHLLAAQLTKYFNLHRTDQDFNSKSISPNANASVLLDLMKKTFRTDMTRRNTVWELIAEYTMKLEQSKGLKEVFTYINMLNNCIHNTGGKVLGKVSNGNDLLQSFDMVTNAKSIEQYEKFVDKDIRRLKSQGQ